MSKTYISYPPLTGRAQLMNRINQATACLDLDQLEKIVQTCEQYEQRILSKRFKQTLSDISAGKYDIQEDAA